MARRIQDSGQKMYKDAPRVRSRLGQGLAPALRGRGEP